MSDTSEAAVKKSRQESPTVDAACRLIETLADPGEAKLAHDFAEIFFSKSTPDFLGSRSTDALANMALGAFRFLKTAKPTRVDVQVVNPEMENEGWYAPVTVIRTNISERPFVVDTIREFLHSRDYPIEHKIYPVLHVERDDEGVVTEVRPSREGELRESLVHCEIPRVSDPDVQKDIEREIRRRLEDVTKATEDFDSMIDAVNDAVAELAELARDLDDRRSELEEVQAFLRWLRDGSFVFLGYRAYDIVDVESGPAIQLEAGSGLGLLRAEDRSTYAAPVPMDDLTEAMRKLALDGPLLIISKTNAESTVHRRARMDYIGVKKLDHKGNVIGEHRFLGLFTSQAYTEPAQSIPILRQKLKYILEQSDVVEGSHDFKEINTIFNSLPKEEIFLASAEEIGEDVRTVLTAYNTDGVRVTMRPDHLRRGTAVMVILPKERFSGDVRKEIERELVTAFHGEVLNYHLALGAGDQARLHFYIGPQEEGLRIPVIADLEASLREMIRSWEDRVRDGLEKVRPSDEARRLARLYGEAFSPEYQAAYEAAWAVDDIVQIESMILSDSTVAIAFANHDEGLDEFGGERTTELNLYLRGSQLILSDFMPILESCGLRVIAVSPFSVDLKGDTKATIYSFAVQTSQGGLLDVATVGEMLGQTILSVRSGDASMDTLNQLVLLAGLHWREVEVLRAYAGYAFQLGAVASRLSLPTALARYPDMARAFMAGFAARFDPDGPADMAERKKLVTAARRTYQKGLAGVESLNDDRALRRLGVILDATLRTNYYRNGGRNPTRTSGGVPYISFKVDAPGLESIKRSRLRFEVYVRSSRMEGVHLRGSNVARGGIRWSDRPDDFRKEVLGLVKTQMVKNAVIVPGGSKGGFVPTRLPEDSEARGKEAEEQYKTLQRGLLDLTDNLDAEANLIAPEGVVCWDAPDPYLVVAADKGTAKFSDVANGISEEYGFWMGDAYASGGTNGYDHKVVGITARGAWECVKRHFRERDKNIQTDPFTVVGIGDMSGDVFGNGMLLSKQIRLIAAFDHRHIFIDPDPDPATTWVERDRLFKMGRSSWADYNESLLSEGGMIIPRGSKEVNLSPEAVGALGLDAEEVGTMDGETLIRAILKAPVELLWNGGIGTYVKADFESDAEASDASNDAVRIDATELRCEVVGEGGNLGFTQNARVQYAQLGGALNTDALDNSGGVDLSDREVNLKILLRPAVRSGALGSGERNVLLEKLTDDVADLVVKDNWSQSLAISLDELRQQDNLDDFGDLMTGLERDGVMDRASESLPNFEDMVERTAAGQGLVRPELCVLLAYSKLRVKAGLADSALVDDPALEQYLLDYFPDEAIKRAGMDSLRGHRLRREIIVSQLTNDLVDLMGATFMHRVARDTGRTIAEVVRAWLVAARLAGHREIMHDMASPERPLRTDDTYRWLLGLGRVLERTTRWVLNNVRDDIEMGHFIQQHRKGLDVLMKGYTGFVSGPDKELFDSRVAALVERGADQLFAERLATLRFVDHLLEILGVAQDSGAQPLQTGEAFYLVAGRLDVPWLRESIKGAASDDQWEQRAALALSADLTRNHDGIVSHLMGRVGVLNGVAAAFEEILQSHPKSMGRYTRLMSEIKEETTISLAGLSVAVRELSVLTDTITA